MTRDIAIALTIAAGLVALLAMFFAWRRRVRRDSGYRAPIGVPEHADVIARHPVLYVATTRHNDPLERLAIAPMAFRARGELVVTDRGVALSLDGAPTVFLSADRISQVDRATVAIDRVVEPGGLVRIVWTVQEDVLVDSFVRSTAGEPQNLIADMQRFAAAPETGASS